MSFRASNGLLTYRLIATTKRLIFDICWQHPSITFQGADEDDYYMFVASNGYQVISRSRMDIQTERIWLLGGTNDETAFRSGTMIFSSNEKRDLAFDRFNAAIDEFTQYVKEGNECLKLSDHIGR